VFYVRTQGKQIKNDLRSNVISQEPVDKFESRLTPPAKVLNGKYEEGVMTIDATREGVEWKI
jgi:hypothetical protein